MKFLGRLVLWQKLLLVVVALLVPSFLLAVFYLKNANGTVRMAHSELQGARYTRAVDGFLYEVIKARAMANVVLNGDAGGKNAALESQASVDKAVAAVDALDAEIGKDLGASADWQVIKGEWSSLKSRALTLPPDDSLAQHNELV